MRHFAPIWVSFLGFSYSQDTRTEFDVNYVKIRRFKQGFAFMDHNHKTRIQHLDLLPPPPEERHFVA